MVDKALRVDVRLLSAQAAQRELSNFDEADLVDEAVRGHHIATGSHVHIPNYIATAGEWPSLKTL
jgi:hypothetical protein